MVLEFPFTNDIICSFSTLSLHVWMCITKTVLSVMRSNIHIDTLHHIYEDMVFSWTYYIERCIVFLNHKWCMYHNNEVWFSGIWKRKPLSGFLARQGFFLLIVLATKYWLICGIYIILWMILKSIFFCINNHLKYEHVDIYCL